MAQEGTSEERKLCRQKRRKRLFTTNGGRGKRSTAHRESRFLPSTGSVNLLLIEFLTAIFTGRPPERHTKGGGVCKPRQPVSDYRNFGDLVKGDSDVTLRVTLYPTEVSGAIPCSGPTKHGRPSRAPVQTRGDPRSTAAHGKRTSYRQREASGRKIGRSLLVLSWRSFRRSLPGMITKNNSLSVSILITYIKYWAPPHGETRRPLQATPTTREPKFRTTEWS